MAQTPMKDADARSLRSHWFRYLDTLESFQGDLHAYCRKLTGSLWEAEDLVQETLLKGFGMTARGDFHGPQSPVRNLRAYLFRTATNCWLDEQRRRQRFVSTATPVESAATGPDLPDLTEAVVHARALTSPAEFACLILKDVCDFSISDIADFVGTTPGTVKSALHRARSKVPTTASDIATAESEDRMVAAAFAGAINARDVDRLLELMADTLQISVCNVGGGRGRSELWVRPTIAADYRAEVAEVDGCWVVVLLKSGALEDVLKLTASEGAVTRLTDYCYAPDLLKAVAQRLGYRCTVSRYHQGSDVLTGMIDTTTLPWRSV